jgi:hypothetical protein
MSKPDETDKEAEAIRNLEKLAKWAAPADPETKNVKLITWRYPPGFRDIDLLLEIGGRQMWLHFDKTDTQTIRKILDEVFRTAVKPDET